MRSKINIHLGDCMEAMAKMPDNAYDLAIVDPPYGIGASEMQMGIGKKKWKRNKGWDKSVPDDEYFTQLFRVSKNQIIWGANHFNLPVSRSWIFWDKDIREGLSFSDGELAWTNFDKVLRKVFIPYSGFRGSDGEKIHPTQKPVKLYEWLLNNYANPGDRILDTHGGSMSIAIACWNMKFDLDLWEIDEEYYEAGLARFEQHKSQLQLF